MSQLCVCCLPPRGEAEAMTGQHTEASYNTPATQNDGSVGGGCIKSSPGRIRTGRGWGGGGRCRGAHQRVHSWRRTRPARQGPPELSIVFPSGLKRSRGKRAQSPSWWSGRRQPNAGHGSPLTKCLMHCGESECN